MWLWIALFTLPFMYRACRHALDALVEETLLFVAEVVRGGESLIPKQRPFAWPALARVASARSLAQQRLHLQGHNRSS